MEKAIKDKGLYWMRTVNLSKVRDTSLLIGKCNGLRYGEIAEVGVNKGIFIRNDGAPLSNSSIYHYINTAFRLGLIIKNKDRKYISNQDKPEVRQLIKINRYLASLNKEENLIFQKLIINTPDCREAFFWVFMGQKDFTWDDFVKYGKVVSVFPTIIKKQKIIRTKKYTNEENNAQIVLETPVGRMAIEWGLQLWGRECSLIDEIYIEEAKHILYPLNSTLSLKFDDLLRKFLQLYKPFPNSDWSFFPIDLTIFELSPLLRISVEELRNHFFLEAYQKLPEYIKFSSSSKGALTFRSLWEKTDKKVLKNFVKLNNVWMTHVLVHKKLWEVKHGEIKD